MRTTALTAFENQGRAHHLNARRRRRLRPEIALPRRKLGAQAQFPAVQRDTSQAFAPPARTQIAAPYGNRKLRPRRPSESEGRGVMS